MAVPPNLKTAKNGPVNNKKPKKKGMTSEESIELQKQIDILDQNIQQAYEIAKKEKNQHKLNEFYAKIIKLAEYVPFVR